MVLCISTERQNKTGLNNGKFVALVTKNSSEMSPKAKQILTSELKMLYYFSVLDEGDLCMGSMTSWFDRGGRKKWPVQI